jgi:hypothetical protein
MPDMPNIPITLSGNVVRDGSTQTNIVNVAVTELTTGQIFSRACDEVQRHITQECRSDLSREQRLLGYFGMVKRHFLSHSALLQSISDTTCCLRPNVDQAVRQAHFVQFIHFCISVQEHNSPLTLPTIASAGLEIVNGIARACTGADTRPMSTSYNVAALTRMLSVNPSLKQGTFYLFNLCTPDCNNDCPNESRQAVNSFMKILLNILPDFVQGKLPAKDKRSFFENPFPNEIDVKCGECLTNVSELERSRGKL